VQLPPVADAGELDLEDGATELGGVTDEVPLPLQAPKSNQ